MHLVWLERFGGVQRGNNYTRNWSVLKGIFKLSEWKRGR